MAQVTGHLARRPGKAHRETATRVGPTEEHVGQGVPPFLTEGPHLDERGRTPGDGLKRVRPAGQHHDHHRDARRRHRLDQHLLLAGQRAEAPTVTAAPPGAVPSPKGPVVEGSSKASC